MDEEDFPDSRRATSEIFDVIYHPYMFLRAWDSDNPLLDFARPTEALCKIYEGTKPEKDAEVGMGFYPQEFLNNERLNKLAESHSEAILIYMDDYSYQLEEEGVKQMYEKGISRLDGFAVYLGQFAPESRYLLPLNFDFKGYVRSLDIEKAMELLEMTKADKRDCKIPFLTFQESVFFNFYIEAQRECVAIEQKRGQENSKLMSILSQVEQKKKSN